MALFCAQTGAQTPAQPSPYHTDTITTRDGGRLEIRFFGHGSIAFRHEGMWCYIDPVGDYADYSALPKATVIMVTHEHGDHLDPRAIEALSTSETMILGSATAIEALGRGRAMSHGEVVEGPNQKVEAFPAYNTSPDKQNFHPAARLHNGYIFTLGGTTMYVAGDTEDTPEMLALAARRDEGRGIDIAFLPVNLPYTMTEEQAARAVRAIAPAIFYPYHYGGTDHKTDLGKLTRLLEGSGVEIRIRPLE